MRIVRGLMRAVAIAGAVAWCSAASAGIITIDFPQDVALPPGANSFGSNNLTAGGFRISPSSEFALVNSAGCCGIIPTGLGWDSDGLPNPDYLGPMKVSTASLFIDAAGAPFSLLGAGFISTGLDDNFVMISSKGGVFDVPRNLVGTMDVTFPTLQPLWTDIDWLIFGYFDAGLPTAGLTQLTFAIDEPGTLPLLMTGLLALIATQRRVRSGLRRRRGRLPNA